VESSLYIWCAWQIFRGGKISSRGRWRRERHIAGCVGDKVFLLMFSTSLTVCIETILYGKSIRDRRSGDAVLISATLNDIFSNFANIGRNSINRCLDVSKVGYIASLRLQC
jgi:hypothetical protein